ncbi:transmembrane protein 134-like [Haliotis cracherodii]|uniref:transmembrane protein 134-like n=1 Tax=Haliotis cracherodii TaxID=6455 RepID=UPI0039EB8DE5
MTASSPYDKLNVGEIADSDDEDKVRLYGSTRDSAPLQGAKIRDLEENKEEEGTEIPLQHFQFRAQQNPLIRSTEKKSFRPGELLPGGVSTHSLSTWSSETIVSTRSFSDSDSWLRHPKVRENWRVVLGSFVLTAIGLVLFFVGIGILASPQRGLHCLVFFIIGLLCFIPGVYHVVYIYFAVQGRPGFSFYNLPVLK